MLCKALSSLLIVIIVIFQYSHVNNNFAVFINLCIWFSCNFAKITITCHKIFCEALVVEWHEKLQKAADN